MNPPADQHAPMLPLYEANSALGCRAELDRLMAEHGYWFFRNVLDPAVIAEMRAIFVDILRDRNVVAAESDQPLWNGAPLEDFPEKIEPLHQRRLWHDFVSRPTINDFFEALFGEPVFWVPSVEYRITPPSTKAPSDLLTGRHQDGFANYGIDFLTGWVPLMDIDERTGGLALADGLHKGPILHDMEDVPRHRIPEGAIPDNVWHRSDYHPGDLVMFCPGIPHSGMVNRSDRFRLSMDVRVMPMSGHVPIVGDLLSIDRNQVTIADQSGRDVTLLLDDDTYCRGTSGARIPLPEMIGRYRPGDAMMASERNGHALLLRPQR